MGFQVVGRAERLGTSVGETAADDLLLKALDTTCGSELMGEHGTARLGPNTDRSTGCFSIGAQEGHFDGSDFVDRDARVVLRVIHKQLDPATGLIVLPYRLVTVHTVTPIQICFCGMSVNTIRARLPGEGQTASANHEL